MKIIELNSKYIKGLNDLLNSIMDENIFTANEKKTPEERKKWFNNYEKERKKGNTVVFVSIEKDEIIGSASVIRQRGKRNHVWEIGYQVKKEYRNKGVGSLLVNRVIEFLKENGGEQLIAWVSETNTASINLLKKFGFQKVGEIKKGVKLTKDKYCNYLLFQKEIK